MKIKKVTKTAILASGMFGLLALSNFSAAQSEQPLCPNLQAAVSEYDDAYGVEMSPFVELDVAKTIASLPAGYQSEAYAIEQQLQQLPPIDDEFAVLADSELERKRDRLEERMVLIFEETGVEPVFTNRLDQLSDEDRTKATKLWCETLSLMEQHEKLISNNFLKIDELLKK